IKFPTFFMSFVSHFKDLKWRTLSKCAYLAPDRMGMSCWGLFVIIIGAWTLLGYLTFLVRPN
ncbi:MAG: hypothetical protein QNJ61_16925, partial [Desulfobacterales bacterium]|nr:hypothetical protein [Desulfobacterales bacterium]